MSMKETEKRNAALRASMTPTGYDISAVHKNDKGGVLVTEEELEAAFAFFDVDGSGKITTANLRKRLGIFYKNMPAKDYRFLMNNKPELTLSDLKDLLLDNEVTNFDPVAEAFKVYDPDGTGFVDIRTLQGMFENLGFGEVTDEDLTILIETGDTDKDGRISLSDFRGMMNFNQANLLAPANDAPETVPLIASTKDNTNSLYSKNSFAEISTENRDEIASSSEQS